MLYRTRGNVSFFFFFCAIFCTTFVFCARAEVLTLAAYNVENYNTEDRMIDGVYYKDYPKPEVEKAALVKVLTQLNPDILAIEEMGGEEFFAEFRARLKEAGLVYPYATLMQTGDPKRRLALVSRVPFEDSRYASIVFNYRGEKKEVLRGLLEARFKTSSGKTWRVFVVHLKSRKDSDEDPESAEFRVKEAQAVRDQIEKIMLRDDAQNYFVIGDFNDSPRSSTLKRFLKKGKRTLTEMLPLLDSRDEEWTHHWASNGSFSRIDYILVSPSMRPAVFDGFVFDGEGSRVASDHRPVVVRVDTEKIPSEALR
jgi:endonuclease/exonuclease/phosphatase family metal-dependent hydrolase